MRHIIVDIAEFMANPLRSGIQRVVREIVTKWPSEVPVIFARYDAARDGLVGLSTREVRNAIHHRSERVSDLTQRSRLSAPISLIDDDVILVPEVFYDPRRVSFYHDVLNNRRCKVGFVVFDFIPWLKPATIVLGSAGSTLIMPYLMLLLRAESRCFISEAVRNEFTQRISRDTGDDPGPVFPLGADSFSIQKQTFSPARVDLVCIGTLDGKKGQDIVFDAFETTRPGDHGRLVCLGRVPDHPAAWMRRLLASSRSDVSIVDSPTEGEIAAALGQARASIFVSTNEGFGLPAVESLHCGVPVVAHEALPCLANLPSAGQIRLQQVTVDAIGKALMRLADDGEARALWSEAEGLQLQTWSGYAASLANWMTDLSKLARPSTDRTVSTSFYTSVDVGQRSGFE